MKNKAKIIFFGTSEFAEIILETLIDSKYKPVLVVTTPDKPAGRKKELKPSPVKVLAQKNKIPLLQPGKLSSAQEKLKKHDANLFIVTAYGKIMPQSMLDIPKHGTINVHPSLLPKYRGPSPIQFALLHGDEISGNTIMLVDESMDHGPMLSQEKLEIAQNDTTESLTKKLAYHGARLLIKTIPDWISGEIKPFAQDHSKATYTKIISRSDGHIDWTKTARDIERMYRAFTPWPGLFTFWEDKRLKILEFEIAEAATKDPGQVMRHSDTFAVQTKQGLIIPSKVQLEGKKPQSAKEFLNGYEDIIGARLT